MTAKKMKTECPTLQDNYKGNPLKEQKVVTAFKKKRSTRDGPWW
jgi:hypothetical protein